MPTPKPFPGANPPIHHYGITLRYAEKNIYLYDRRDGDPNWKGAATVDSNGEITRVNVADFDVKGGNGLSLPRNGEAAKHAIIHTSNAAGLYTAEDQGLIVLRVSTTAQQGAEHQVLPAPPAPAAIVELSMKDGNAYRQNTGWLGQFLLLSFEEATEIAGAANRGDLSEEIRRKCPNLLDITHPGDPTAPLAFRLLCEAWEEKEINRKNELSGFEFEAPANSEEWRKPFTRAEGQTVTIEEVVALMVDGDFKGKVRAVLDATDGEAMKKAVLNLLGRADDPTGTEGGAE